MQPQVRSIDGIAKRPAGVPLPQYMPSPVLRRASGPAKPAERPERPQQPAPAAQPAQRRNFTPPPALQPKRRHRWWRALLFPAVIIFSLMASFLVQSQPLGMAAIAIYAVVAWVKKIPSRHTFVMAFMALAAVVLLLLVRQNVLLAGNFSTYTFLLLVVGIISVLQESQSYPKRRNSKILNLRRKKRL